MQENEVIARIDELLESYSRKTGPVAAMKKECGDSRFEAAKKRLAERVAMIAEKRRKFSHGEDVNT